MSRLHLPVTTLRLRLRAGGSCDRGRAGGRLWQPTSAREWHAYFLELLGSRASLDGGAFFALSLRGKSVGSGLGVPPWDELLGTRLPPLGALSPDAAADEAASPSERSVLAAQERLYDAITSADAEAVRALCVSEDDAEVSALQQAGRLDSWSVVLQGSASRHAVGFPGRARECGRARAWSTGLEFPTAGGSAAPASASVTGSLLCTQRWVNVAWCRRPGTRAAARAASHHPLRRGV